MHGFSEFLMLSSHIMLKRSVDFLNENSSFSSSEKLDLDILRAENSSCAFEADAHKRWNWNIDME
jgi:hypothetical protein